MLQPSQSKVKSFRSPPTGGVGAPVAFAWLILLILLALVDTVTCSALGADSPEKLTESKQKPLKFGGTELGYGTKLDFLRINKGNPLAQAACKSSNSNVSKSEFLFYPDKAVDVLLKYGKLKIARHTAVYIEDTGDQVSILDLHDNNSNAVLYVSGSHKVNLTTGSMLCLRNKAKTPVVGVHVPVPQRLPLALYSTPTHAVVSSEFSIVGAMPKLHLVAELKSSEEVQAKHLWNTIFKSATVSHIVTQQHGAFHSE